MFSTQPVEPSPGGAATPSAEIGRSPAPLRGAVITGSTRVGRVGERVTRWFVDLAGSRAELSPRVVDLADFAFPARYPATPTPETERFTTRVGDADAFVIVTPEYHRSFPASLKQAIDYADDEWQAKPVGFVSYGCASGGRHAVEALRPVFTKLHTVTLRDAVRLDLGDEDRTEPPVARTDPLPSAASVDGRPARVATALLVQLLWWGLALREARAIRPYVV